jgi:hypothetical protein
MCTWGPKYALITWHSQYNLCSMFLIWEPNMNNSAYLALLGIWKPEQQSINIQSRHSPPSPSPPPPLFPPLMYYPKFLSLLISRGGIHEHWLKIRLYERPTFHRCSRIMPEKVHFQFLPHVKTTAHTLWNLKGTVSRDGYFLKV